MRKYDVVVIGGGPAGLFCALQASLPEQGILLLEKNANPGAKLLLSGSGQCNITHSGDIRDFLSHYGDHGKQVKPALFGFTNRDLIEFFRTRGLAMMTEENGKVFPETRRSEDVLSLLMRECKERGVDLHCGEPATGVLRTAGGFEIITPKESYFSPIIALSTGGASYPKTGSTGDGYRVSASLGQPRAEIAPALTPLLIRNYPFAALAGLSFERMQFSVWRAGKKIADHTGDVLFTHLGLSGPGILDASRYILPADVITLSFVGNLKRDEFVGDLT
jgi:predicted Rossmann fold flavoprotein